jgi:hypothetical protein
MITKEGKLLDKTCPRREYPRPQIVRDSFLSLNGEWEFSLDKKQTSSSFPDKIIVPFSVETALSNVNKRVAKDDFMHYKKTFSLPKEFVGKRLLLHFDAVDQIADVWFNGTHVVHHEGGYIPFEIELTSASIQNEIVLLVKDDTSSAVYPRGKQSDKPGGIWYNPTSGIWGNVWLEALPDVAIRSLRIDPDFDGKMVSLHVETDGAVISSKIEAFFQGKLVGSSSFDANGNASIDCSASFYPWSPEEPNLYDLIIEVNDDRVASYFGMRKFGICKLDGKEVFALNGKPYLMKGVLDQGYFPDGGLTAPSDQAMIEDIVLMKQMGFNMLRKHIKIEPARWYYHCDRLGMLVIQDFVNNGAPYNPLLIALSPFFNFHFKDDNGCAYARFGQGDPSSRSFFMSQLKEIPSTLHNAVSLCAFVLFNEGWGQFDSLSLTKELRKIEPSRLIDSDCGWYDQEAGDFSGKHIYFKSIRMKHDGKRVLTLSEFGGYSQRIEGHCFSKKNFGYKICKSKESLEKSLTMLFRKQLKNVIKKEKVSSYVFTQLSDVEQETNGLITYDREIVKVDVGLMASLNEEMKW